jgi:2-dehydro-3-deoxyphosphogluconate aldolase/(4S)-4-hydroxy-2-oxoglutarate aldolase
MRSHFEILKKILDEKIIAIVRLDSAEHFVEVADALKAGGITVVEFTLTTSGALDKLKEVAAHFGNEMLIGAGTVLDPETARAAILAGAEFIVTPTFNPATIEMCKRYGKPIVAGALTPTEMLNAWQAGADLIKVFPVGNLGGVDYIKAVLAPLPQLRLVPTGGVNAENAASYLKVGAVAIAVGGNLVDKNLVKRGEWNSITAEAQRLVTIVMTPS